MLLRSAIAAAWVLALGACASTGTTSYRHADGDYQGAYDGAYYAPAHDGYGDYYYDRPQIVDDGGYGCGAFGYGFGAPGWSFGMGYGYDPWLDSPCGFGAWYGMGYPWGWYRPWPRHRHHGGPPNGWVERGWNTLPRSAHAAWTADAGHFNRRSREERFRVLAPQALRAWDDGDRFGRRDPAANNPRERTTTQR